MNFKIIIPTLIVFFSLKTANSQVTLDLKERPKPVPTFNFKKISANKDFIYNLGVDDKGPKSVYYIEKYNAGTLGLEYQKDLKICADDKSALVHPLFVPPVCFESNNQLLVFYSGYNETDKKVSVNVKTVNENGDVNSKWNTLIASKDIEVTLEGMYWNFIGVNKPVISYYLSEDKRTVIIEIDSPKFKKIYSYAIADLIAGKTEHKEFDIKSITDTEKIVISKCFEINNTLSFSYVKKLNAKSSDFGIATLDPKSNTFQLKNLGLNVNELFSLDYKVDPSANQLFIVGYLRYPINASKAVEISNTKVKPFNVKFNFVTMTFESKNEFDFKPEIAKYLSVPKTYGFIDKTHTPDQYLENTEVLESENFYYQISNLLFGRGPSPTALVPQVGGPGMAGGGVTTVCRDILVSKFDKTGKLISQFLLPRHTGFNTFAGSRSGAIYAFANRQLAFNFGLKGDDLHFFYLDNKNNVITSLATYDPGSIDKCTVNNGALVHVSIKNDKIEREILAEKDHKCYFYSNQNVQTSNAVVLDVESGKKDSETGRILIN